MHEDNEDNEGQRYFEFGAHFRYIDLVQALKYLQDSQIIRKDKEKEKDRSININNNSDYNEVYNQINKQLCQKMTDIIPPNKFIQSRNIKPLIQSLSQKLTDIIQSQNNKRPMKHYATKKKQINSKIKNNNNNNINININSNNNINNKIIAKTNLENNKKNEKNNFILNQPYKKKEISQSRNFPNAKKPLSKNIGKKSQINLNQIKKNNFIPKDTKHFGNTQNKIIQPLNKKINNNSNNKNNNEKIFGTVISNNKINNVPNTQTVQNIIVKSNINISFINNFNTTYMHKSKKKQKKIRSRNNQELSKLNMIGNKFININNHIEVEEDFNNNNKIFKNKNNDNNTIKNKNNLEIILIPKNENKNNNNNNTKELRKKSPGISPKLKISQNVKKNGVIDNHNIKINNNNNNNKVKNLIKKDIQIKGNNNHNTISRKKLIVNGNKSDNGNQKLINNFVGKVKIHI